MSVTAKQDNPATENILLDACSSIIACLQQPHHDEHKPIEPTDKDAALKATK